MPKATRKSACVTNTSENELQEDFNLSQESSSENEVVMQSLQFQPSTSQSQVVQPMYMPYIEGPKIDWTVNDSLYHRFLKWKIKCENILDCELAMLSETRKCKKIVAWLEDFGIDQYVSWCLPPEDLCLEVIWNKCEEFCKPQTNEVSVRFDLLTGFRQGDKSVDEWYNIVQAQINLAKYPPETAKILHRDIFCFFLRDEELVSKTINGSNIDLEKFPASKVRQCAKKLESSKSTARLIKQVSNELQVTQVNLLRHQRTEIPPNKSKRKQFKNNKSRSQNVRYSSETNQQQAQYKKRFNPR